MKSYVSSQNYGGGLSPIGDGLGGAEDKMVPRPPQPNGSLHIKIDEVRGHKYAPNHLFSQAGWMSTVSFLISSIQPILAPEADGHSSNAM